MLKLCVLACFYMNSVKTESYKMSLDIENKSNIRMPQSGASVLSTSTSTSSASKSAPIQMIDSSKNELLKKLGITLDQYNAIKAQHPDFDTLSLVKQLEIVKTPVAPRADLKVNNLEKQDVKVEKPSVSTSEIKDIKAEYNKKDLNGKTEICYSELARNTYIYGVKDKDKVIAEAHSKEEWDKLSDKEKEAEVTKVKAFIDNDERLKNIKDKYNDKVPDYAKEMTIDAIMRAIHAADAEGISFVDFMKKGEYERKELIERHLVNENKINPENLNKNDKEYLAQSKMLNSEVTKVVEKKTGQKLDNELDTGLYVKYYNLSEDELLHSALKEKVKNGEKLTDVEQKQYARYNKMMAEPSNQQIVKEAKAQNILELDKEFNTLSAKIKKGETLSPEERKAYSILKETLNSEESKELRNFGKLMPQPQTDYEKKVAADVENYKAQTKEYVHGSDLEAGTVIAYIGNKTDGMSKAEKTEYIAHFIRYNRSLASSKIFARYMKECPELAGRVETLLAASSNYTEMDATQRADFNKAKVKAANSNNLYLKATGINSANTVSYVLAKPEYSSAKFDEMKLENAESNAQINDTEVLKNTTSANATIHDAETAVKAQACITNSDYFNDEVAIDTANKARDFVKGAQARVLNMTTDKNAAAAKYVAENDIIRTLHADAQAEAFDGTYNSINKHFKGAEADKYSQSLTSQIKGLDAKAQVEVYNSVSGSRNATNSVNNFTNPIQYQGVKNLSENTQQVYNYLSMLSSDGKPISRDVVVKMFQKLELNEQRDFLKSLSPQQVAQIPISVCNSFPELIETFVDMGKGVEIIQQCNIGTGNKTIQLMAKSKGSAKKQFNDWAANHTDRLAKCTYDAMVESGAIKINKNKAFTYKG